MTKADRLRGFLAGLRPAPTTWLGRLLGYVGKLGPYAAIELLLPGGTLLLVALWLYRRYRAAANELVPGECALGGR